MADEAENRPARTPDDRGSASGGDGLGSPLQTRAAFLKNRDWVAVVSINQGACQRGGAQHGINPEIGAACAADWEKLRGETLTLAETLDRLRAYHSRAPFFFFNGNTFAPLDVNWRWYCLVIFRRFVSEKSPPQLAITLLACLTAKAWSITSTVCARQPNSNLVTV
jgi:hypothetical protein